MAAISAPRRRRRRRRSAEGVVVVVVGGGGWGRSETVHKPGSINVKLRRR